MVKPLGTLHDIAISVDSWEYPANFLIINPRSGFKGHPLILGRPWLVIADVNSNLVQYLLQTDIQKRTEKIQWQIQTLHRDFSLGNPNRENQHILY
jgi:hypothetical protein